MEFEKVRDIIVETLGCDAEAVTPTEIGRASCRERV